MGAADERLRRLLDRQTPSIRRTILNALRGLSQGSVEALTEALERADVASAVAIAVGELDSLTAPLAEQLRTALTAAARVTSAEFGLRFDMADPNAIRVAQSLAANAVVGVELETKQAIRDIIVAGIRDGIPPRSSAREIMRLVGLTDRDARAADALYRRMLADGVSEEQAAARQARYADRLLRRRAENIARTETINAATQGRRLGWSQAADAGYLDPSTARIVWIVTQDDRLCAQCAPMAGMTVGFYDSFTATERATGDLGDAKGGITPYTGGTEPLKAHITVNGPPLHPSCRCDLGLVFGEPEAAAPAAAPPFDARDFERDIKAAEGTYRRVGAENYGVSLENRRFDGPKLKRMNQEELGKALTEQLGDERLAASARDFFGIDWEPDPGESGEIIADRILEMWADDSTGNPGAYAAQRAIADEFGFGMGQLGTAFGPASEIMARQGDEIYDEIGDILRAFARAEYDRTQRLLAPFGDTIPLIRGTQTAMPLDLSASIRVNPASSFSTSFDMAQQFANDGPAGGSLYLVRVPRERILSTAYTGRGSFPEQEFIVLGGRPLDGAVIPGTTNRQDLFMITKGK